MHKVTLSINGEDFSYNVDNQQFKDIFKIISKDPETIKVKYSKVDQHRDVIKKMLDEHMPRREIVRQLKKDGINISRKTIYNHFGAIPTYKGVKKLEPYKGLVKEWISRGMQKTAMLRELEAIGVRTCRANLYLLINDMAKEGMIENASKI